MTSLNAIMTPNEVILSEHRLYNIAESIPALAEEIRLITSSCHLVKTKPVQHKPKPLKDRQQKLD